MIVLTVFLIFMSPKTVFITGANRGIGLGLVKKLLENKEVEILIAGARNIEAAEDLQTLAKSDSRLQLVQIDVSSDESITSAFERIDEIVGNLGLNLLINNAGIFESYQYDQAPDRKLLLKIVDVNAIGTLLVSQHFLPLLRKAADLNKTSKSIILNIGSDCASQTLNTVGFQDETHLAYKMSKAAMLSISRSLAADFTTFKIPILVTMVHPGWVLTEMGGPDADITVEQSAVDLVESIEKLGETHHGGYFDRKLETMPF